MQHLLNTDSVSPRNRARVVLEALGGPPGPCRVSHLVDDLSVWARWRHLQLSPSADVLYHRGSAMRVRRLAGPAAASCQRLLFAVSGSAGGLLWQYGSHPVGSNDLILVDLNMPYDYRVSAGIRSCLQIDLAALGVPITAARAAAPALHTSSLYPLARDHVRGIAEQATTSRIGEAGWMDVVAATTDLLAALLLSCSPSMPGAGSGAPGSATRHHQH